jgi:type II secretory pathway component GspD/PulD (secretin)
MPGVSVGDLIGGGTGLFGITANDNTLQMFHSFLEENSNVAVLQEPSLTTTSGVPAKFQKFETRYYNTVSEEASGTDVSAVGVSNKLVPVKFGSLLSINPRYDVEKDLVRAQISFEQSLNSGEQLVIQTVSSKDVPTTIPIVSEATYSGEALLKDGDMIIIGGQKETISNFTDSGMIGVKDTFLSPLVGKKKYVNREITYYFALQMHIEKQ